MIHAHFYSIIGIIWTCVACLMRVDADTITMTAVYIGWGLCFILSLVQWRLDVTSSPSEKLKALYDETLVSLQELYKNSLERQALGTIISEPFKSLNSKTIWGESNRDLVGKYTTELIKFEKSIMAHALAPKFLEETRSAWMANLISVPALGGGGTEILLHESITTVQNSCHQLIEALKAKPVYALVHKHQIEALFSASASFYLPPELCWHIYSFLYDARTVQHRMHYLVQALRLQVEQRLQTEEREMNRNGTFFVSRIKDLMKIVLTDIPEVGGDLITPTFDESIHGIGRGTDSTGGGSNPESTSTSAGRNASGSTPTPSSTNEGDQYDHDLALAIALSQQDANNDNSVVL